MNIRMMHNEKMLTAMMISTLESGNLLFAVIGKILSTGLVQTPASHRSFAMADHSHLDIPFCQNMVLRNTFG
jgi:hypothetical protein